MSEPWIGVDLDGTLAAFDQRQPERIGPPIPAMLERVFDWLALGYTVKIVTARFPTQVEAVQQWLADNQLPLFEITNAKDFAMIELWDDRAVQVAHNCGRPAVHQTSRIK